MNPHSFWRSFKWYQRCCCPRTRTLDIISFSASDIENHEKSRFLKLIQDNFYSIYVSYNVSRVHFWRVPRTLPLLPYANFLSSTPRSDPPYGRIPPFLVSELCKAIPRPKDHQRRPNAQDSDALVRQTGERLSSSDSFRLSVSPRTRCLSDTSMR